ncbi:hypothetical protein [Salmonella phage SD-1_S14]|nr:hypothetical protein [Salmonella phage SD-2_S15]WPK19457.1 hypothetical protein [Salmonella phage SD-6_S16]WPK20128.1 hypothetical protein [Salmonella phage SD-1_S14]WPK21138.1 hypothetical protein [Salmonella phage SD-15_S21]
MKGLILILLDSSNSFHSLAEEYSLLRNSYSFN